MSYLKNDKWHHLCGQPIGDIHDHVRAKMKKDKYSFHVGSDSKSYSDHTLVITTICFREPSSGALVAYQRTKVPNFSNITEKLIHETLASIEAATMVLEITGTPPTIHADVNSKKEALSNKALSVIVGMVRGMGFSVKVKPNAWAADIADMFTR